MKKLITIAAAAAVLGAGVYAEPAKASEQLMERYNDLVHRGNALASKGQAPSTAWCKLEQEKVAILKAKQRSGGYFERDGSSGPADFEEALTKRSTNVRLCSEKGYLPRPRTAPVAQRGYSSSTSAAVDNWMCTSVAGSMGSPLEAAMMAGMAGCSDSQTAAAMNASSRKNDWCRARGYSNGWVDGKCQGGNNASYGRSEMGLPEAW